MSDPNNMPNWQLDDMRHNGPYEPEPAGDA